MVKKEEESGSGTREKNGAASSGGGGGRYVDTSKALNPIWLMKCPPVVAQSLRALPSSSDPSLPGAKVIVSVDPLKPEDHPSEFTMELGGGEGNASRCFAMDMSKDFMPMSVFSDSTQGKVSVEGKIVSKIDMRSDNQNLDVYGKICRERTQKYTVKNRQIQIIDNDNGAHMRPMPGMISFSVAGPVAEKKKAPARGTETKRTRRDRGEMEEIIFKLFERQPNWSLRNLIQETDQPEQFLKDILKDLCVYNNKGTNQGTYELKPEYRKSAIIMSTEPSTEQAIKALQAQNAQFQELVMSLAQGQQYLKTLILKERKKKKKRTVLFNTGRRFGNGLQNEVELTTSSVGKDSPQERRVPSPVVSDNETDYDEEQYSPAEDRYKQLEDRLSAMEIQNVPGLDFGDIGLSSGVVIPHKFKAPAFAKYDGNSCPKLHLRSYVRKIQPYIADKNLWIHFFQDSLSGTQLEWFYQLDGASIRNWEDLATAFYKQYQYNSDLAPTRTQLQGMSLGTGEGFKEYAQKWRDLAGRVQPPLTDRELVDMFLGTLSGPFFNHLIGNSSAGFTNLILTGERIEAGIKAGKIQKGAFSSTEKKSFKKEYSVVYGSRRPNRSEHRQAVNTVVISKPAGALQYHKQQRGERLRRQFTRLSMTLSQILPQLLTTNLVTLREAPKNPNTTSPKYNPNARCAYHSDSPGHSTDDCWTLKNKVQDLIDANEVEFEAPERPNVVTAPMPKHGLNAIEDDVEESEFDSWIYPTTNDGPRNWTEKDFVPITFVTQ